MRTQVEIISDPNYLAQEKFNRCHHMGRRCMGFPINVPQYGKMQQNPWYGKSLRNWYSYFSHSMGAFFPLDSHPIIYFIIWEIHGFPHQFLIVRKNETKPFFRVNLGNWYSHFSLVWVLFSHTISIQRYTSSYGKCKGFPINFP